LIIRRHAEAVFIIGNSTGIPQLSCGSLEEALERAGAFETQKNVRLWYTSDGRTCAPVSLLRRIWNEYIEMPGLTLTAAQGQRLWAIDSQICAMLLESLVELRFLVRDPRGRFARLTEGAPLLQLRMAKVEPAAASVRERA
jgi:hypothetical protein